MIIDFPMTDLLNLFSQILGLSFNRMNRKRTMDGYEMVTSRLDCLQEGSSESFKRLKRVKEGLLLNLRTLEAEAERWIPQSGRLSLMGSLTLLYR